MALNAQKYKLILDPWILEIVLDWPVPKIFMFSTKFTFTNSMGMLNPNTESGFLSPVQV